MRNDLLFYGGPDMFSIVEHRRGQIKEAVEKVPKNTLLNASEEDLIAAMVEDLSLAVPAISDHHTAEINETKVDVSGDPMRLILDPSKPFYIPGTTVVISIPFQGDPSFFRVQPSTYSLNPPRGTVVGNELRLSYTRTDPRGDEIKRQYESDLQQIQASLQHLASAADQFHRQLPEAVRAQIQSRKTRLLAADGMVASLGLSLKLRDDSRGTVSVPIKKRVPRIEQIRTSTKPYVPEPTLASEDYEAILRIMTNMVLVMERSPHAFVGMGEEDLRMQFLVQLNGQYEGRATGETFNFEGKTDILIRENGKNVFIAECKVWKGPKELLAAFDQLLSYLSWRDTKAALIVFSRNANFSEVLASVKETVPTHRLFKRTVGQQSESSFRYILGQPGDVNRETVLTVLAFDVPTKKTAPGPVA
jgi:hypothetical protein